MKNKKNFGTISDWLYGSEIFVWLHNNHSTQLFLKVMKTVDIQPSNPNMLGGFQGKFLNIRPKLESKKSVIIVSSLD